MAAIDRELVELCARAREVDSRLAALRERADDHNCPETYRKAEAEAARLAFLIAEVSARRATDLQGVRAKVVLLLNDVMVEDDTELPADAVDALDGRLLRSILQDIVRAG